MPTHSATCIELLESRIAPASLSGGVLKYSDLDGDLVQITFSAGASLTLANFTFDTAGAKQQLQTIDIHGLTALKGGSITEKVTHVAGGDGQAPIGYINAAGVDLGIVKLAGDLGRIDAGTDAAGSVAIKSLDVKSMGFHGTATQASGGNLNSVIKGGITSLTVAADLRDVQLSLTDTAVAADAKIGTVRIGGSVDGAKIQVAGGLGTVTVGGTVSGSSAFIATGAIASLSITHDLVGSSQIKGGSLGIVKISGSLNSSTIDGATGIATVTIGVDMHSGAITSAGIIKSVTVTGSLDSLGSGAAKISAVGDLTSITVRGRVEASTVESTGGKVVSASFGAFATSNLTGHDGLGVLAIKGDLASSSIKTTVGGITSLTIGGGFNGAALLVAGACGPLKVGGDLPGTLLQASSFASITVGGSSKDSEITSLSGNITSFKVGGSLIASGLDSMTGTLGPVTVGGDCSNSRIIGASIGPVKVTRSILGPTIKSTTGEITSVTAGGSIVSTLVEAAGRLGPVTVGRDLFSSSLAGQSIGAVKVGGDMDSTSIGSATDLLSVSITGSVSFSTIAAGVTGTPASATIGKITVGGNWLASNVSAGVKASNNNTYGNATDTVLSATSSIASIIIKGILAGTADPNDHYGFDARKIGSFKLGGFALPLNLPVGSTPGVTPLSQATGDVNIVIFA